MLIQENIPLATLTTFGIGGPARYFAEADSVETFLNLRQWAEQNRQKIFVLGQGSNIVFTDQGFSGLVIRYTARKLLFQENFVSAEAGAPLNFLILEAEKKGLGGMEKLFGIPGTLGGAIYNNAGAFGVQISDFLQTAQIFELAKNKINAGTASYFQFNYRSSILQKNKTVVLSATLALKSMPAAEIKKQREEFFQLRQQKQPRGRSAGSFFKNPKPDLSAGFLLEQIGAKGMKCGGIQVSEKHSNFLINTGDGTFADLKKLANELQAKVKTRFGIDLEQEVEFVEE